MKILRCALPVLSLMLAVLFASPTQAKTLNVLTPYNDGLVEDDQASSVTINLGSKFQTLTYPADTLTAARVLGTIRGETYTPVSSPTEWLQRFRPFLRMIGATPTGKPLVRSFIRAINEETVYFSPITDLLWNTLFGGKVTGLHAACAHTDRDSFIFFDPTTENGMLLYHLTYAIHSAMNQESVARSRSLQSLAAAGFDVSAQSQTALFLNARAAYDAAYRMTVELEEQSPGLASFLAQSKFLGAIDLSKPVSDQYIVQSKKLDPKVLKDCGIAVAQGRI